ncbi:MAG: hypothetical protein FGM15_05385 [Chthoniobacterales bacterium]|nr:hypothetical protein [Chthoniobacterales bacterium]
MVVYLDTTSGLLTGDVFRRTPVTELTAKRGTDLDLYVVPERDIPPTSAGLFAALPPAGGAPMALASWLAPARMDEGWLFPISLRGSDLAALFASGTGSVLLNAEVTAVIDGKTRKSQTILMTVYRDIYSPTTTPPDVVNIRRTNIDGYQEYSFNKGATWWKYAPIVIDGVPEWQWTYLGENEE